MRDHLVDRIHLIQGDITSLQTDAIVNAANNSLMGGGGVDGAIHRAAGPELKEYCRKFRGCDTGEAVITPGFNLKAKWVIHTVGPVWVNGTQDEHALLDACYANCLKLAEENDLDSIAFPSISTGAYRFPIEQAHKIAIHRVVNWMEAHKKPTEITFCCYSERDYRIYRKSLSALK